MKYVHTDARNSAHSSHYYNYILFSRHRGNLLTYIILLSCQNKPARYVDMKKRKLREVERLTHGHRASMPQNQDLSTISLSIKPLFSCLSKVKMITAGKYRGGKVVACWGGGEVGGWATPPRHCFCGVGVGGCQGRFGMVLLVESTVLCSVADLTQTFANQIRAVLSFDLSPQIPRRQKAGLCLTPLRQWKAGPSTSMGCVLAAALDSIRDSSVFAHLPR